MGMNIDCASALQTEVWVFMELMATCLDRLLKKIGGPFPETIVCKMTVSVSGGIPLLTTSCISLPLSLSLCPPFSYCSPSLSVSLPSFLILLSLSLCLSALLSHIALPLSLSLCPPFSYCSPSPPPPPPLSLSPRYQIVKALDYLKSKHQVIHRGMNYCTYHSIPVVQEYEVHITVYM